MNGRTIFSVTNHHVASCGVPPQIDGTSSNCYRGYFENEHGEQAIFVYDRTSQEATLYMGDAGWEHPHRVVDGRVPDLVLAAGEQAWLKCCWQAAVRA